jgi:hypothetical protein
MSATSGSSCRIQRLKTKRTGSRNRPGSRSRMIVRSFGMHPQSWSVARAQPATRSIPPHWRVTNANVGDANFNRGDRNINRGDRSINRGGSTIRRDRAKSPTVRAPTDGRRRALRRARAGSRAAWAVRTAGPGLGGRPHVTTTDRMVGSEFGVTSSAINNSHKRPTEVRRAASSFGTCRHNVDCQHCSNFIFHTEQLDPCA